MRRLGWMCGLLAGCAVPSLPDNPLRADRDGDGLSVVDGDCDDGDPSVGDTLLAFVDADGDSVGVGALGPTGSCSVGVGYSAVGGDCDDGDPSVGDTLLAFVDADLDGFGAGAPQPTGSCSVGVGFSEEGGDCDDTLPEVYPGATERCANGVDDDCDLAVDGDDPDAVGLAWFPDEDADGYGDAASAPEVACEAFAGRVGNDLDCDDQDPFEPSPIDLCSVPGDQTCGLGPVVPQCGPAAVFDQEPLPGNLQPFPTAAGDLDGDGLALEVALSVRLSPPDSPDLFQVVSDPEGPSPEVVTYLLPVADPAADQGDTVAVLLDRDRSSPGLELAVVDTSRDFAAEGSVWLVDDPLPPGASGTVELGPALVSSPELVHRIGWDQILYGQRIGFSALGADLLPSSPGDELVITAPNLASDEDRLYLVPGGTVPADLGRAITLYETSAYVDALGVDAAATQRLGAEGAPGLALVSLGSAFDAAEVIVLDGADLVDGGSVTSSPFAWYELDGWAASTSRTPSVAFGDLDGDQVDDLVVGLVDDSARRGRLYLFEPTAPSSRPVQAEDAAWAVLDLPHPSCGSQVTVLPDPQEPLVVLACPDWPEFRGTLLVIRASDLPAGGVLDASRTAQVVPDTLPWSDLGAASLLSGSDLDEDGLPEVLSSLLDLATGRVYATFEAPDVPRPLLAP